MTLKHSDEKIQFWRRLLDEQPRSGMTVKAFCQQNGVSVPSFYSWRAKIRPKPVGTTQDRADDQGLVPVTVIAPANDRATDGSVLQVDCIEIVTPAGFTLRVHRDLRSDDIARLLQAMGACRCGASSC